MRKQIIFLLVCVVVLAVFKAGTYSAAKSNRHSQPTSAVMQAAPGNVVFSVPVGADGISYANTDSEETEPWGPSALRLGPDGSFLIVDSVSNRILRFDSQGRRLQTVSVNEAVGITDVVLDEQNFFVLDESAATPTVLRLSRAGQLVDRQALAPAARSQGLSGITKGETGEVLMELQGGTETRKLTGGESFDRALRGNRFSVSVSNRPETQYESRARISLPNGVTTIDVENLLGGVDVLSVDNAGNIYVLVEEVTTTPEINVDQTIRRLRPDGTETGRARVPMNSYTSVRHNVAVSPEGYVYALVTKRDRADVVRLEFRPQLPRVLATSPSRLTPLDSPQLAECTRTREQMAATAETYLNNSVNLNLTNLNGSCSGRTKPRYLGSTPGKYQSVAYDWGGWDTVSAYNQHMADGKVAGDINSEAVESCSHGVDCSGFVTVCWGITTQKYGTRTLPEISNLIDGGDLKRGDILNKAGTHVIMFDKFARDPDDPQVRGIMAWESTTTGKVDRVVYRWSGWNRLEGYVARRYKKVCN